MDDPFEDILNLEEQFYQDGYKQGQEDGVKAGRSEGRSLGLEKGFQKFIESGRLYGRAIVWANRLPGASSKPAAATEDTNDGQEKQQHGEQELTLPPLPKNPRLEKHITTLYALVEADTLSTENTDEAVNDFDDRVKRAQGKAKIIERMVGEVTVKKVQAGAGGKPDEV
ncbi:hypothetical protein B0T17DRAFT_503418 [Bombardia bombarda]|uniref:Essential protein Yae1 N-terminal domain-containing protein n=1 Tax=Bombardia bombarda TaxID=252184 RepID=A0AA39XLP0_9PEZI|nr:hypothetical protein B0T17DRAFT_503418 [Bombardia bombarda]